ncbi:MAG: hypothetical protein ACE10G_03890 [Gemmatimonadales bacterium]
MGWAPTVTAIATVVVALIAVGLVVAALPLIRQASRTGAAVERFLNLVQKDSKPLIEDARSMVSEANRAVIKLRAEIDGVVETSQDIRTRVGNAADAAESRLLDLEALLDVVQEEVEETVLDVAAALRTTRRGSTILRTMKRVFLGSGKKRRRKR